jgi:CheY-like chemotaxis protein
MVKDSGTGIPEEKLKNIFEDFSQADTSATRKHGGTGLGLAISKSLIEMMNGTIWVEPQEKGALFHFTVILGTPEIQREEIIPTDQEQESSNDLKEENKSYSILVVEDEPTNQILIKMLLSKAGHKVILASNGIEALEEINKNDFDIVFMDVQMPEMDGLTATIVLRDEEEQNKKKHLPIIALTAHVGDQDIKKCFDSGMDAYLSKPIKKGALFETIKDIAQKFII